MDKILAVIPTFNEVQSVPLLLDSIFLLKDAPSVLIVDDSSSDGTLQKIRELQKKYPRLFLLIRPEKLGIGSAYREGFGFAIEKKFESIVQMDADLTHGPDFISRMIDALRDHDLVIASRYVTGAHVKNFSFSRRFLSRLVNFSARVLLRLPVTDATSGFRVFRRTALERISVETTTAVGFAFQIETVWRAHKAGLKIAEVPFSFVGRRFQRSKFSFKICWEALRKIVTWAFTCSRRERSEQAGE